MISPLESSCFCSPNFELAQQTVKLGRSDGSCEQEHRDTPESGSPDGGRTADRADQNPDNSRPGGRRESTARGKPRSPGKRVRMSRVRRCAESRKKNTSLQKRTVLSPLKDSKIRAALGRPSGSCVRKLDSRFQNNLEMGGKLVLGKKAEGCPRGGGIERRKQKRASPSNKAVAEKLHGIPQGAVVVSSGSSVRAPYPNDDKCSFCHSSEETEVVRLDLVRSCSCPRRRVSCCGAMFAGQRGDDPLSRRQTSRFGFQWRREDYTLSQALCGMVAALGLDTPLVFFLTRQRSFVADRVDFDACRAPNVYFDGDRAVNLAAEVARSRRISCSHCGVKGAALGCFERSCRKSFHYTCAKLISGCRWDDVRVF